MSNISLKKNDKISLMSEEVKKKRNKVVSYSQFAVFSKCPMQFKLDKIDRIGKYSSNIHLVFGTAIHETIQDFLEIMYGESKKTALTIDLHENLLSNMKKEFLVEMDKMKGKLPCSEDELHEFYQDGCKILTTLKNKLNKFYPKSGYELIGNEIRLEVEIKKGVSFWGFIDVCLKDIISGKVIIVDIKTSTKGWSKWDKADKVKCAQMLLYKKLYSEKFDIPLQDITVEYHILKRKVGEYNGFPLPRMSKFVPANGKPSVNKAWSDFMNFVNYVFDEDGNYKTDVRYEPRTSPLCNWCDYKLSGHCPAWSQYKKD